MSHYINISLKITIPLNYNEDAHITMGELLKDPIKIIIGEDEIKEWNFPSPDSQIHLFSFFPQSGSQEQTTVELDTTLYSLN